MWRQAFSELRLHPGRFVATLIAIAISVGFISAISVFVNSQRTAMGGMFALPISKADLIVTPKDGQAAAVAEAAGTVPGVEAASLSSSGSSHYLTKGSKTVTGTLYAVPDEALRWSRATEGRLPDKPNEIAVSAQALNQLDARVGDTINDEGVGDVVIVGKTDDPNSLFGVSGYTGAADQMPGDRGVIVKLSNGANQATVTEAIKALPGVTKVEDASEARDEAVMGITGDFDLFKNMLQSFAAIALLVGAITIGNTFTILATQRRRQLALLRAIGATPGQVTGRLLVEAFLLGAIGSLLGLGLGMLVAWGGGAVTGSNFFGLTVVPSELFLAWLAGVIATVVSAVLPSLRAAQVKPLEALQVVPTAAAARRASLARAIICAIAAVIGIGLILLSRTGGDFSIVWAMLAGVVLTIAVLGGAPLYVAPILRALAKVFGFAGPTTRLALTNAARNPRRAASTATALMLAIGLIVTLQVALSTTRSSGMAFVDERYPIDVSVTFSMGAPAPADAVSKLEAVDGVKRAVEVESKRIDRDAEVIDISAPAAGFEALGLPVPKSQSPADDEVVVGSFGPQTSGTLSVPVAGGAVDLTIKTSDEVSYGQALVSPATFAKISGTPEVRSVWVQFGDRTSTTTLNGVLKVVEGFPDADTNGSGAVFAGMLNQLLGVLLIVMSALLGVAVLIALVGVGNTLGLSVIERQRESALLRALGMQRVSLRAMLLIEAIALVGVGTVIGLAAGMFFGWLGVETTLNMIPSDSITLRFSLDWVYTAGLIGVCLLAAILASILPGRRAANATPTEALAVD